MGELVVKEVNFNGATLMACEKDEKVYVAVRWVCEGIGLSDGQMKSERKKIQEDLVLSKGGRNIVLPTGGGTQEVQCIELDFLPLWLAKISITPKMQKDKPEVVTNLIEYQLKAKEVLANAFVRNVTQIVPTTFKESLIMLLQQVEENEKKEIIIKQQVKEIEHKSEVIQGFTDEITLAEKRQILNQVVRKGGVDKVQSRWTLLYKNYEAKCHINLRIQLKNYNEKNKPKLKGKLDYIDKVRNDIDGLYEIACKLFESDIEKLTNELYELRKNDCTDVILLG